MAPLTLPPRKPMARARRVSLFEREIRIGLSSAAIEILLSRASVLSEGQVDDSGYFGSTMITVDTGRIRELCSDPCDATTARRLGELVLTDPRFREDARRLGEREACRLAGEPVVSPQIDLRVRVAGCHLHVDLDVEASITAKARAL